MATAKAGSLVYDTKLEKGDFEKGLNDLKKTGSDVFKTITASIVGVGASMVALTESTREYRSDLSKLQTNALTTGNNFDKMKGHLSDLVAITDETDSSVEALSNLMQTGFNDTQMEQALESLSGAIIAFPDTLKIESLADSLQETIATGKSTGQFSELLGRLGINVEKFDERLGKATSSVQRQNIALEVLNNSGLKNINKAYTENNKTLLDSKKAQFALNDSLAELSDEIEPTITKVKSFGAELVTATTDWIKDGGLEQLIENIQEIGIAILPAVAGMVTFAGVLKIKSTVEGVATAIKTLNTVMLANPYALMAAGIALIATSLLQVNRESIFTVESVENMANGFKSFGDNVKSAQGYLGLFAKDFSELDEKSTKITSQMEEIQNGITAITEKASNERRELTQSEINKIEEYFNKLHKLQDEELKIQEAKAKAVQDMALTIAQTQDTSLEEYQANAEQWIATAQQQADEQERIIEEQTINEIALLNKKYGDKATLENEQYAKELEEIQTRKEERIAQANDEVGKITATFAQGFLERTGLSQSHNAEMKKIESERLYENLRHENELQKIKDNVMLTDIQKNFQIQKENEKHNAKMKDFENKQSQIWANLTKNMSKEEQQQLGVLIGMAANTELYGGKLDSKTQETVNNIIKEYNKMPKETRNAMKNAMDPMLEEMQKKEPSLFAKASNIANGILNNLKKAFDIHSPSRKTREIFKNVMLGAEEGISSQEKSLYNQVDNIADNTLNRFQRSLSKNVGRMSVSGINGTVSQIITANNNQTILLNNNLNLDGETIANSTNKINGKKNLQYSFSK